MAEALPPLPVYMHPMEFSQLTAVLEASAPRRCLEWGCGGSTLAVLAASPFVERWVSVEHDRAWAERVRSLARDPRLDLHHVAPNVARPDERARREVEAWDMRAEADASMLADYVARPRTVAESYDFVLVDGRARCFCLAEGFRLLRSGGVIVLHDAQRAEYRAAVEALGRVAWLTPWKQGQIALVRKP